MCAFSQPRSPSGPRPRISLFLFLVFAGFRASQHNVLHRGAGDVPKGTKEPLPFTTQGASILATQYNDLMCGRYMLTIGGKVVCELFGLSAEVDVVPRYNIAPSQEAPIVRIEAGQRRLAMTRWGLVPPWARDAAIGARLINARSETAAEKPSFRTALRRRRCLVPADGFYEWKREGAAKQPYCIRFHDHRAFAIAGLWETWRDPTGELLETHTLLTTSPNVTVAPIHARMPVIIDPRDYALWLNPEMNDPGALRPLFQPYPGEEMEALPASRLVNSPAHEGPRCLTGDVAQ